MKTVDILPLVSGRSKAYEYPEQHKEELIGIVKVVVTSGAFARGLAHWTTRQIIPKKIHTGNSQSQSPARHTICFPGGQQRAATVMLKARSKLVSVRHSGRRLAALRQRS